MAKTNTYRCARCGDPFTARVADRNRGWARFCSKSCKAIKQEARTGQYAAYKERTECWDEDDAKSAAESGWDGHKNAF